MTPSPFNSQQEEADFRASFSGCGISANVDALDQLSKEKIGLRNHQLLCRGRAWNSTISFNKKGLKAQIREDPCRIDV